MSSWTESVYARRILREAGRFAGLEEDAASVCLWQSAAVPGLLQTDAYTSHYISARGRLDPAVREIAGKLATLQARRRKALRPLVPVFAVLHEAVLHGQVGGPDVLHGQLLHLAELARRPTVDLRILPLDSGLPAGGSWAIFGLGAGEPESLAWTVAAGQLRTPLIIEDQDTAHVYRRAFTALRDTALDPAASRERILETAAALDRDASPTAAAARM